MIKRNKYLFLFLLLALCSCRNSTTYNRQRDAEDALIKDYITRNQLNILTAWPDSGYVWGEKDYLLVPGYDNYYYHLVDSGNVQADTLTYTDEIIFRFRKYTLNLYADTISYWTTMDGADPVSLTIGSYATSAWTDLCACQGVALALRYMKYNQAEAKIICPSKMGIESDESSVTPYCYDLKIKGIKK